MSEPVAGPSFNAPLQPSNIADQNIPLLSKQIKKEALALADQLQKILENPSLSSQESFLKDFNECGNQLNKTVEQAVLVR